MNLERIRQKLAGLADKRAFSRASSVPERTVWRIISGKCNPTQATLAKAAEGLKRFKA